MDDSGKVGQAYGARTTPHMYVIDPNGVLVYAGGIDDKRSANPADVKTAKNYRARGARRVAGRQAGQHGHRRALRLQRQVRRAGRLSRVRAVPVTSRCLHIVLAAACALWLSASVDGASRPAPNTRCAGIRRRAARPALPMR